MLKPMRKLSRSSPDTNWSSWTRGQFISAEYNEAGTGSKRNRHDLFVEYSISYMLMVKTDVGSTMKMYKLRRLAAVVAVGGMIGPASHAQLFERLKKTVIEPAIGPAVGCGQLGATLGTVLGDEKAARWSGLGSAALCAALSIELDRRRRAAVEAEEELDRQIEEQQVTNATLSNENENLKRRVGELEDKAGQLRAEQARNPERALRIATEIKWEKDAAVERIMIIDRRIEKLEVTLNDSTLGADQHDTISRIRDNQLARRAYLQQIVDITVG